MDEIQELVRKIVRRCASRGVTVSEVLAAFVARTVSEGTKKVVERKRTCGTTKAEDNIARLNAP